MIEVYKDVGLYFKPLTAENILDINADFCIEDRFGLNESAIGQIESKLYAAYYHFLSKIHGNRSPSPDVPRGGCLPIVIRMF